MAAPHPSMNKLARALAAAAVVIMLLGAVAASLSDRAPRLLRLAASAGADTIRRVGEPVGLGGFDRTNLPIQDLDQLGHMFGWAGLTLAAALLLPHVALRVLGPAMALISTALEPLQSTLSKTRTFDPADLEANLVGIAIALVVAAGWRLVLARPARRTVQTPT